MRKNRLSDLFAKKQLVRFWLACRGRTTASKVLMVAVAWQMYDTTLSAWDLGRVGLSLFVPALLMTFAAAHVVDRLHRERMVSSRVSTRLVL